MFIGIIKWIIYNNSCAWLLSVWYLIYLLRIVQYTDMIDELDAIINKSELKIIIDIFQHNNTNLIEFRKSWSVGKTVLWKNYQWNWKNYQQGFSMDVQNISARTLDLIDHNCWA